MNKSMPISEWSKSDQPRQKMISMGTDSLSEAELLAIIINTGCNGKNALELARDILVKCDNSLVNLCHMIAEPKRNSDTFSGLGQTKLCAIQAAIELGRRKAGEEEITRLNAQTINSSSTIFAQFNNALSDLNHEELWALYCSKNGKILLRRQISEGGTDFAGADIKKIVRPAIEYAASSVCLCHNHPHSSVRPSRPDRDLTHKVKEALTVFDIRLLDHIIISDGTYFSFADAGEI